jgi:hypothetical protein
MGNIVFTCFTLMELMMVELLSPVTIVGNYHFFSGEVSFEAPTPVDEHGECIYYIENTLEFTNTSDTPYKISQIECDTSICKPMNWTRQRIVSGGKATIKFRFKGTKAVVGTRYEIPVTIHVQQDGESGFKIICFNFKREVSLPHKQ